MTTAIATEQLIRNHERGFAPARTRSVCDKKDRAPISTTMKGELDGVGTVVAFARGRTVVEEGDPADVVFKVVSGALRTVRLLPDGRRSVISFLLPGDFFGLAEDGTYSHSLEALADSTLVRYSKLRFEALIESDASAGHRFFSLICKQLSQAQDRLLLLGRKSAIERMATFLLAMADRAEAEQTAAETVLLPMSRSDVADYLGLTVETVSRVLTQLRTRGLIALPAINQIVIRDREQLEAMSENEN